MVMASSNALDLFERDDEALDESFLSAFAASWDVSAF